MKPLRVEVQIGRVVWHGPGAPSAERLAAAVAAALAQALACEAPAAGGAVEGHAAEAIAARLRPSLPPGAR